MGQPVCLALGSAHVFCHPDRGAYTPGTDRFRNGKGACPVTASRRTSPFAPQHVGDRGCHRCQKDRRILFDHRCSFHHSRHELWMDCRISLHRKDAKGAKRKFFLSAVDKDRGIGCHKKMWSRSRWINRV